MMLPCSFLPLEGDGLMVLPAQHLRAWRLTRRKRPVVSHQIMMLSTARAEDSKAVDVGYGVSRASGSGRSYHTSVGAPEAQHTVDIEDVVHIKAVAAPR